MKFSFFRRIFFYVSVEYLGSSPDETYTWADFVVFFGALLRLWVRGNFKPLEEITAEDSSVSVPELSGKRLDTAIVSGFFLVIVGTCIAV